MANALRTSNEGGKRGMVTTVNLRWWVAFQAFGLRTIPRYLTKCYCLRPRSLAYKILGTVLLSGLVDES